MGEKYIYLVYVIFFLNIFVVEYFVCICLVNKGIQNCFPPYLNISDQIEYCVSDTRGIARFVYMNVCIEYEIE